MSIKNIREALDNKEISVKELCEKYFDNIKKYDNKINSYITFCEKESEEKIKKAQEKIDKKQGSMLTGMPVSIKDNICTKGIKTTCASKMLESFVPDYDATAVERLENEGAIILGKTNMDEFAMGSTGDSSIIGGAKNPYNISLTAGGSSGGAAASVAGNMCVAALGSDTGGSIRQPAALCGVTGIKPTYGAVSRYGLVAFASSLDQIGVAAKSAEDTAYVLSAISGYDQKDMTSSKIELGNLTSKIGMSLKDIKIGVAKEFFVDGMDGDIKSFIYDAIEYYKALGCEIKEVSLPSLKHAVSAYYIISSAEASSNLARYDGIRYGHSADVKGTYNELISESRKGGFSKEVKKRILTGNYVLGRENSEEYYKNALRIRGKIKMEYNEIFSQCDLLLTPTTLTSAIGIFKKSETTVDLYSSDLCTVSSNLARLPGITTTCGYTRDGLPVGMSLVGREFDEALLIGVADRFERDFQRREIKL